MPLSPQTLILKFGGAALASPEHFAKVAAICAERRQRCQRLAVVVSAMGDSTDALLELAKKVNPNPPRRELDMLISTGERVSTALLAMALAARGIPAMSFTGSQTGIVTTDEHNDAKIVELRPHRVLKHLDAGEIVVVAGFQGVSRGGAITTLGRGGSDTTAVALGLVFGAAVVEFFKDVPGVFDADPRKEPAARHLPQLDYETALHIVRGGAQVLHERALLLAQRNQLPLRVGSFESGSGEIHTWIGPAHRPDGGHILLEE